MFVTAISTLLNTTGLEFVTKREADLQRELTDDRRRQCRAAGLGGYVSTHRLEPHHAQLRSPVREAAFPA